jgi:K+-transporting ATPase ATPase A chain
MLYTWSSATENNGSAFAGLSADAPLLHFGLGSAILFGRFAFLIPYWRLPAPSPRSRN